MLAIVYGQQDHFADQIKNYDDLKSNYHITYISQLIKPTM